MQIKRLIQLCLVFGLLIAATDTVFAQAKRTKKTRSGGSNYSNYGNSNSTKSNYGNYNTPDTNADTSKRKKGAVANNSNNYSNYGTASASASTRDTSLPITSVPVTSGGLLDSVRPSLRNDAPFEQNLVKDKAVLDYENLREDDAAYRVRVWREIDTREKINLPFRYAAVEDNGSQRFISILLRSIKDGSITAFSADDDRFTTPITPEDAQKAFGGGSDTSAKYDLNGNVIGYEVRPKVVDPDSIYLFRIKEEWIFDKKTSRMYARILGIAPVVSQKLSNGETLPNSEHPTWWLYYPDLRPVLAKYMAYNPKNFGARMTWEELFENRMFSSYIVKSTLDNPYDQFIKQYVQDPLFRLYTGEAVKDKIFDYEQNLWSY